MNNKTLIWTLIVAVPVGLAALAAGYIYRDTGRLPFQDGPATAVAPAETGEEAQPSATADAPADSEDQTAENAAPAPGSDRISATFDVVGVEPTGETVVAGRSEAGAIVALTANGSVIGKSIANEAGEWTIILDEPLKPGDYDVGLEVHDDTGSPISTSRERVAVSLPEGGKEQPLIVLNTPDGPSDILQKPAGVQQVAEAAPAAPETSANAAAEAPAADAATPTANGEQQVASAAPSDATPGQATSAATNEQAGAATTSGASTAAAEDSQSPAPSAPQSDEGATVVVEAPEVKSATGARAEEPQVAAVETQPSAAPVSTQETTASGGSSASAPEGQDNQGAAAPVVTAEASSADPAVAAPQAAPDAPTVTVEAVESEQDKVYVAGTGAPGSSVRVYVGDEFQGEAKVDAGGKWLVQGSKNISEGNVEVRADLIGNDGDAVDARAAVTFEKEKDQQIVLTKVVASGAGAGPEGQDVEVQKALPVVIIRKGDNLWRISRRLYGHGVRYTTIYQANQEQIRNPDLIYPGQVFLTPEGDLNWKPLPENNG